MSEERTAHALRLASEQDIHLLLLSPGADMRYLSSLHAHVSERPTLLAVGPEHPPALLLPKLELGPAPMAPSLTVLPYGETDDPYQILATHLSFHRHGGKVAVSESMRADVLLRLQQCFPGAAFVSASSVVRILRMKKSDQELALLAKAGAALDRVFERLIKCTFFGRTEREVARDLSDLVADEGLEPAEWGPIVASGQNSGFPHHSPGEKTLDGGDAVLLDFGGVLEGYQADISRTVSVGEPSSDFRQVYDIVRSAQEAAVRAALPGVEAQEVDAAARRIITEAGFGQYFVHRTGHGIGLECHEEPYIVEGNVLRLEQGMTHSVEPGIYLPDRFGVRIEDIVVVRQDGAQRLNNCIRELVLVR